MTARAVLFDFSGTLFDDSGVLTPERLAEAAVRRGRPIDRARATRLCRSMLAAVDSPEGRAARAGADRSAAAHREVWVELAAAAPGADRSYAEAFHDCATTPEFWRPCPDTVDVLRELSSRGVPVGVVSNIAWDIRLAFARAGLAGLVDDFVLSYELGVEKPDPALFLTACRALGVAPEDALMVGDDPLRDGGAVTVGMPVLLLPATGGRGLREVLRLVPAPPRETAA